LACFLSCSRLGLGGSCLGMEISFPFVACVRTAGRKKIFQIVDVQFLQGGLGPFRGLDAPRCAEVNDSS